MTAVLNDSNICLNNFCEIVNSVSNHHSLVFNNYHTYFSLKGKINYSLYCIQRQDIVFFYFRIPRNPRLESLLEHSEILYFWDERNLKYRISLNSNQLKDNASQLKAWVEQTLKEAEISLPVAS